MERNPYNFLAERLPAGTEINNVRLVNNQSTGRKRRETAEDFVLIVDTVTEIEVPVSTDGSTDDGPTIVVDVSNPVSDAVQENGGTIIDTEVQDTTDDTENNTTGGNKKQPYIIYNI